MRNKVRKSLAFLLALALVVSVMSGLGLSVSAEQESNTPGTEEVQQQDKTEAGAAPSEVKAEEEAAKPEGKPVLEEKEDEQKKQEETKTDDAAKDDANAQNGDQKDEPQAEPAEEEQDAPVEEAVDEQALPTADAPRATMSNDIVIPEPSYEKKAEYSGQDDVYDLSLSVSGSVASQAEKSPVDIVLILDESNSMVDGENGEKRWTDTKKAANALINALDQNKDLNVRYDIVGFDGYGNGKLDEDARSSGWKTTADSAKKAIPEKLVKRQDGGGTDYQAGIRQAINDLKNARVGAQTVVVFLSDGTPTFRLTAHAQWERQGLLYENNKYGNGQNDAGYHNIDEAVNEIKHMNVSQFYAIGLGGDFNKANSTAKANLIKLNNAVNAAVKADDVYTTKNSSGLEAIFKAIAGKVNNIACKDVKITDNINTQYAQVVTQTNGNPTKLTITVKKADGTVVKSGENSITLDATELNKEPSVLNASYQKNQLVLDFPDKYQLEDGWTYTITTQVKPTQAAYEYYSDHNGSYPNIGDTNTGTHSGERGFWSNTSAVLDYTVSGTGKHATYAQPVIQVKAGTLKIKKSISGLTPEQIDAMKGDMTFTIKKDNKPYKTIQLSAFDLKDRTYTYEMPYCVPGATYTVTESGMAVEGFDCATKVDGTTQVTGSATIEKGETRTIAFTNVYTPSTQDLTITKEIWVDGKQYTGNEFKDAEYTFTVHGEKLDKDRTVTVKGAGSEIIRNLPVGFYTITETNRMEEPAKYEFKETDPPQEITLSKENHAVTITNKYETKKYKVYVRKELDGNMYDSSDRFDFTVDGEPLTLGKDQTSGAYEVTYGGSFTVKETDDKGYTSTTAKAYKATVSSNGTVSADTEVDGTYKDNDKSYTLSNITKDIIIVYTNTKTINPPNGIITTIAPYAIMVVLAAGAGVYFVYSRRRRNR